VKRSRESLRVLYNHVVAQQKQNTKPKKPFDSSSKEKGLMRRVATLMMMLMWYMVFLMMVTIKVALKVMIKMGLVKVLV
jgi:uncharacterized membrane protein